MISNLFVVHRNHCSLHLLVECDHFSTLVFSADPQKVLVVCGVPTTVDTAEVSNLLVNIVHLVLNFCDL
jgi:hypothetical protein